MSTLNKPTTLQIINHGVTISVTIDHSDVTIGEMFDAFKAAMVGITFSEEQMRDYMAQLVYEWQTWDEQK
jgi:N-acetylglucosamine-6-phosphate deacetylase